VNAFDLLIRGALLVDGTGAPPRPADLGVVGGRIAAVGAIPADAAAARTIDAAGLVLCPGFVDVHTHSDISLLQAPAGESKVRQGVTTEVVGNCSFSAVPLAPERLDLHTEHLKSIGSGNVEPTWTDLDGYRRAVADLGGTALNVAVQVGHGTLRIAAMGLADRPPTPDELALMERLLDVGMAQGALGISM